MLRRTTYLSPRRTICCHGHALRLPFRYKTLDVVSASSVVLTLVRTQSRATRACTMATAESAATTGGATEWPGCKPLDGAEKAAVDGKAGNSPADTDDEWPQGVWSSTAEPHHLPGYSGFVPGLKSKAGLSFGALTSNLLRDENVSGSGHIVLTNFTKTRRLEETNENRHLLMQERTHNFINDKYVEHMCVPGYTGHIPQRRLQIGGTYADSCFYALSDFANDQRRNKRKVVILKSINRGRLAQEDLFPPINVQVPLHPIAKEAGVYISKELMPDPVSPYVMAHDDPKKFILSGYSGFVPRLTFSNGRGYSRATHECICEFNNMTRQQEAILRTPVIVFPKPTPVRTFHGIYPCSEQDLGMNPRYTGYIPGIRQKIGMSFGTVSKGVRTTLHQDCHHGPVGR
ncbi:hypothetical protein LSAT2_024033 [Lamellibrachia satsuma]|nr:hypothetical protein LSAT2_024033 [Lamellibrachia satsuma]